MTFNEFFGNLIEQNRIYEHELYMMRDSDEMLEITSGNELEEPYTKSYFFDMRYILVAFNIFTEFNKLLHELGMYYLVSADISDRSIKINITSEWFYLTPEILTFFNSLICDVGEIIIRPEGAKEIFVSMNIHDVLVEIPCDS